MTMPESVEVHPQFAGVANNLDASRRTFRYERAACFSAIDLPHGLDSLTFSHSAHDSVLLGFTWATPAGSGNYSRPAQADYSLGRCSLIQEKRPQSDNNNWETSA
jgi:hypothetical protein